MSDRTRLVIEGILDGDGFHQTNGASFREWLNAHDAQIRAEAKVEALREASAAAYKDKRIQGLQRTIIGIWTNNRADEMATP